MEWMGAKHSREILHWQGEIHAIQVRSTVPLLHNIWICVDYVNMFESYYKHWRIGRVLRRPITKGWKQKMLVNVSFAGSMQNCIISFAHTVIVWCRENYRMPTTATKSCSSALLRYFWKSKSVPPEKWAWVDNNVIKQTTHIFQLLT